MIIIVFIIIYIIFLLFMPTPSRGASIMIKSLSFFLQFCLTPLFRLVALGYLRQFDSIVARNLKKNN